MRMRSFLPAAAVALMLGTPGAFGASLLTLGGGTLGTISHGNDLLEPLGFGSSLTGYSGATVSGTASAYRYEFLGFEAGARNLFTIGSPALSFSTEDFAPNFKVGDPLETVTTDFLDFAFLTSLSAVAAADDANSDTPGPPNFFASFGDGATMGDILYVFFDDSGAGSDGDHDDMVVRITALSTIPVPAPIGLLLGSLVGLALLSRSRRKAAASYFDTAD